LLQYGAFAGALVGVAAPVLAGVNDVHAVWSAVTAGGVLGAYITLHSVDPQRASSGLGLSAPRGSPTVAEGSRVDVQFTPESLLFTKLRVQGNHPLVSLTF
jgi:hypothetical protein